MKETKTQWVNNEVVKVGQTAGGRGMIKLKRADGTEFLAIQMPHEPIATVGATYKEPNYLLGEDMKGYKTYYQQPEPMKGDTTYVPSDDLGQKAPTEGSEVVVKTQKELVQMLALSAEDATRIVCAAFVQAKGDSSQMDFFAQDMKKMIKKVMLAS